ncbi:hypothetical protein MUN88_15460 [Gracilibacillus caseinilyticus]|uniref:Uncharacterized protein n=1 Tax=Gracilibacillus caseinilyticus TaxID=2932256 RepID=A0ABY4ESP9_9BACI|nr:hypothetical protein [Gracilibacillus caseinilyticus]UOQ47451.1 hypothetical protein MUN88_15460 [Gracilibacillus caseinilyticus]
MIKSRKLHIIICILMMLSMLLLLLSKHSAEETIKYFPLDTDTSFVDAKTNLQLLDETGNDQYRIKWTASSTLDNEIYLRQDVSLLYMDGQLKGMKGLWKENEKDIALEVLFEESDSSHFQAISFHHGEIHYPNDEIKSIQRMTVDQLYVIDSPYTALESFREPNSSMQEEWKETIDHTTTQQLQFAWKQWINESNLDINHYTAYPLTSISKFENTPMEGLTQEQTDRIMGQLWEGLYRNYILPISNQSNTKNQTMPIILIDKNHDHLIVLFENENYQLEQLYQKLSITDKNKNDE